MFLEIVRSQGLAHLSYIFGDGGRAAVVDPRRDWQIYIDIAYSNDAQISHIFETHRNEDYVIGSKDLARHTGADIYHGSQLPFEYGTAVREGEFSTLGCERTFNNVPQVKDRNDFIRKKVNEHHYLPPYFKKMEEYNLKGAPLLAGLPAAKPYGARQFANALEKGMSPERLPGLRDRVPWMHLWSAFRASFLGPGSMQASTLT